jgi:hypothetical protein
MKETASKTRATRREVLKKGSYVVPAVLTLAVKPSFATAASGSGGGGGVGGATGSKTRPTNVSRRRPQRG